jgi:hypothetical protein
VAKRYRPAVFAARRAPPATAGHSAEGSEIISEALSVAGRGRELFELMREHDLEGIVAKRLDDPYDPRVRWLKIKNPDYSQKEGRGDLFNRSQHAAPSAD